MKLFLVTKGDDNVKWRNALGIVKESRGLFAAFSPLKYVRKYSNAFRINRLAGHTRQI